MQKNNGLESLWEADHPPVLLKHRGIPKCTTATFRSPGFGQESREGTLEIQNTEDRTEEQREHPRIYKNCHAVYEAGGSFPKCAKPAFLL